MADQENDETKTPFTRRGARPFGGPAGPSAPSRPFIRPAAVQRPTAAPFVAPVAPGKLVLRNPAPTPVAPKTPTPIAPPSIPAADIRSMPLSTQPVANEIAALDAIDAFDAVWGVSDPPGRAADPEPVASSLDEASLGSGIDGQQLWADDITATDIPVESDAVAAPVAVASSDAVLASTTPVWLEDDVAPAEPTTAPVESEITPAMDDVPPPPAAVQPVSDVDGGYGFGEWTDAHTIPASDEIMGVRPDTPAAPVLASLGEATPAAADWPEDTVPDAAELPRFELVATNQEPPPEVNREEEPQLAVFPAALEAYSPHEARIAAAFDRLADRVRSGEIDVSSIAPEATDAAVLASVLAALLGGSRSR